MKKIDFITFQVGHEVLNLRLKELSPYIDLFVIVESTHDFQAHPKPLHFKDNPITGYPIKHIVTEPRHLGDLVRKQELAWDNVNAMVDEGFRIGAQDLDASDVGFFSDFDEIMRPSAMMTGDLDVPTLLKMDLYYYWLNCRVQGQRYTTTRQRLGDIRDSYWPALMFRYAAVENKPFIPDAGWHFTSFGGLDTVMEKLRGYPDNPRMQFLDRESVWQDMLTGTDFSDDLGHDKKIHGIGPLTDSLPKTILDNPKEFINLMHPDWRDV